MPFKPGEGAPAGNKNAAKAKLLENALRKAVMQYESPICPQGEAPHKIATNIVQMAVEDKDKWAIEFITDRLDGKPKQTAEIEHTGAIEHRGLSEIGERVRDILSRGTVSDSPALLPH